MAPGKFIYLFFSAIVSHCSVQTLLKYSCPEALSIMLRVQGHWLQTLFINRISFKVTEKSNRSLNFIILCLGDVVLHYNLASAFSEWLSKPSRPVVPKTNMVPKWLSKRRQLEWVTRCTFSAPSPPLLVASLVICHLCCITSFCWHESISLWDSHSFTLRFFLFLHHLRFLSPIPPLPACVPTTGRGSGLPFCEC